MDMPVRTSPADIGKAGRLKLAREQAGFRSARKAAEDFGFVYPTYSAHENGNRDFGDAEALAYSDIYGVRVEWLVFGIGQLVANPDYRVGTAENLSAVSDNTLREAYLEENFGLGGDHLNHLKSQAVSPQVDDQATASHVHARENDILTAHEKHMQGIADNSGSMIEDAIELHAALVEEDAKLYDCDGKPLADKAVTDASWRREIKAFRVLVRMKCRTAEEAQAKLRYFMRPAASDEYSNMERLVLDAYVDEHAKGSGISDLTDDFLQSLLVERV